MAIQSMMFSSTWQILESYLEDSPSEVRRTPHGHDVEKQDSARQAASNKFFKPLPTFPESPEPPEPQESQDSSPSPSDSGSLANSPASSKTSAFSDELPVKPKASKEIRRRRTPEGIEPRPKNLTLTKSNGATNLPAKEISLPSATSSYDLSPSAESPPDLPPPPPPKMFDKFVQRIPIMRKPVQATQTAQSSEEKLVSRSVVESLEPQKPAPVVVGIPSTPKAPAVPLPQKSLSRLDEKPAPPLPQPESHPPRSDSIAKGSLNFPNPKTGLRPAHKKSVSSTSQNKELPPKPPSLGYYPPPLPKNSSNLELPQGVYELPSLPSEKMASPAHARRGSSTAMEILRSLRAESPMTGNFISEDSGIRRGASTEKPKTNFGPSLSQSNITESSKPSMDAKAIRPGISRTGSSESQSSNSSLTSSSLMAPFPQPDISPRARAAPVTNQRAGSRSRSSESQTERSRTPQTQYPTPSRGPSRTPSSSSVQSFSQRLGVPSRSNTPQTLRSNSPQPSISSLPGVPEVSSPSIAPELKPCHFSCYIQHRPLLLSSNTLAPVLCMTCKENSDPMWKCSWCCLRICGGCKVALGEMERNLEKMVVEHRSGNLKIGQDRAPEASPIERSITPGSSISNKSDTRSPMPPSNSASVSPFMGNLPPNLMVGQNRGPPNGPPVGFRHGHPMNGSGLQPLPGRTRADSNRSDISFERMPPSNLNPRNPANGKPLPPPGSQMRPPPAAFGDIPIGINMRNEMRRPMQPMPRRGNLTKATLPDMEDDGEVGPDFDLGIEAGPGGMAAAMKVLNPNVPTASKLPTNPAMGLGIGSLGNGKPKGLRDRMLMA